MTYQVPKWPHRWPRIANDAELADVNRALAELAECGCRGGCRCPLPQAYHDGARVRDEYIRSSSRAVMEKLRKFRDSPKDAYQDRAEVLAELVQVIGWEKPIND